MVTLAHICSHIWLSALKTVPSSKQTPVPRNITVVLTVQTTPVQFEFQLRLLKTGKDKVLRCDRSGMMYRQK